MIKNTFPINLVNKTPLTSSDVDNLVSLYSLSIYDIKSLNIIEGETLTDKQSMELLFEVCDKVHSRCDSRCPVYASNGNSIVHYADDVDDGCACFKSSKLMLNFLKYGTIDINQI